MVVEFIGCTGAGKTTLAELLRTCRQTESDVICVPDLLLDRPGLRRIKHPTAMNLAQDVCALSCISSMPRPYKRFIGYSTDVIVRHPLSIFEKANNIRSIIRRVGMFHLASQAQQRLILSDEGTVLTAHHLFVTAELELSRSQLKRFVDLVPLPDKIIYVRAQVTTLSHRAVTRPDPRRQFKNMSAADVEKRLQRTVDLFNSLAEVDVVRDRLLIVDNDDVDAKLQETNRTDILDWLDSDSRQCSLPNRYPPRSKDTTKRATTVLATSHDTQTGP